MVGLSEAAEPVLVGLGEVVITVRMMAPAEVSNRDGEASGR